jgi:tRNA threonylcarbamoyladenosine biosynthesis protein TsaE
MVTDMNEIIHATFDIHQVDTIAGQLQAQLLRYPIMGFSGPLGAGKTTLIAAIIRLCGVMQPITSPTFAYVNIYQTPAHITLYHFDLYRIKTAQEFSALGFEEYLHMPNAYVFIEWPEVIMPLLIALKNKVCLVTLDYSGSDKRSIKAEIF